MGVFAMVDPATNQVGNHHGRATRACCDQELPSDSEQLTWVMNAVYIGDETLPSYIGKLMIRH